MNIDEHFARALGLGRSKFQIQSAIDLGETPTRLRAARMIHEFHELDSRSCFRIGALLAGDPEAEVRREAVLSLGKVIGCVGRSTTLTQDSRKNAFRVISRLLGDDDAGVAAAAFHTYLDLRSLYPSEAAKMAVARRGRFSMRMLDALEPTFLIRPNFEQLVYKPRKMISLFEAQPEPAAVRLPGAGTSATADPVPDAMAGQATGSAEPSTIGAEGGATASGAGGTVNPPPPPPPVDKPPPGPPIYVDRGEGKRYVNSWFVGHSNPLDPLNYSQEYELGIEVGPQILVGNFTKGDPVFPFLNSKDEVLDVVVGLVSEDFELIGERTKRMKLPSDIKKKSETVTFKVKPIKNNQDVHIDAFFYLHNNLIHEALIGARVQTLQPQPAVRPTAYNPPSDRFRAEVIGPRDVCLQVRDDGDGFRLVVFYDIGGKHDLLWCRIPANRDRIAELLRSVREDLLSVINTRAVLPNGREGRIFYDGEPAPEPERQNRLPKLYSISNEVFAATLKTFAKIGRRLYNALFESDIGSPEEKEQARIVGRLLRDLSQGSRLRIQVLSNDFFIPWNLLYDGVYPPTGPVKPEDLWGFKHTIDEIPNRTRETIPATISPRAPDLLGVGMNVNQVSIERTLSEPQLDRVRNLGNRIALAERFTEGRVLEALQGGDGLRHLEYFYCHAGVAEAAKRDFDKAYIGLSAADHGLTLEEIKLATTERQLSGRPVVFLNACESVLMDGRFYDGFVPKFLSLGARAVIGSDCEIPSLFGGHFGMGFLDGFFAAKPIGELLLELRKRFLTEYQNPLGLIYRVFGNAEVRLAQPLN